MAGESEATHRSEVDDELPKGLSTGTSVEVPDGVGNSTGGDGNDTLLGPDPAELGVRDEEVPGLAHVLEEILDLLALDSLRDEVDGRADLRYTSGVFV
jgi:hypothetical protein